MAFPGAVIFDLDGTLVDSAPDIHAAANAMLAALDRPALDAERVVSFVGNGVAKLVERCLDATGGPDGRAQALFDAAYARAPAALTRPYPGVREALAALDDAGCALGIVTNKPAALTGALLEGLSLGARFRVVLGGDSLARMKPDPLPLLTAAARLGAGDAVFIGDSETDEAAAESAGMRFGFFTGGYRRRPAAEFEADFAFDRFADLPGLLGLQAAGG
ncbi:MAG: phosphoglycolate phosphatase [Pikeienuella sp.]